MKNQYVCFQDGSSFGAPFGGDFEAILESILGSNLDHFGVDFGYKPKKKIEEDRKIASKTKR